MQCPRCADAQLTEYTQDGIRVDACPQCRGLWLDKGELEQLISRSRKHHDDDEEHDDHHGHRGHHEGGGDHHGEEHHGYDRHDGHKRLKPRRWLESLGDLFG